LCGVVLVGCWGWEGKGGGGGGGGGRGKPLPKNDGVLNKTFQENSHQISKSCFVGVEVGVDKNTVNV